MVTWWAQGTVVVAQRGLSAHCSGPAGAFAASGQGAQVGRVRSPCMPPSTASTVPVVDELNGLAR